MNQPRKNQIGLQIGLLIGILLLVNFIGSFVYGYFDLTEDKRYTITKPTTKLLEGLEDVVTIKIYLEGDFPAGFERLQSATKDLMRKFRSISPNINYEFINPTPPDWSVDDLNKMREKLVGDGLAPVNLQLVEVNERSQKIIFPGAVLYFRGKQLPVSLLENEVPGMSQDMVLNNSVGLLEYKFANAIQKLNAKSKPNILYTQGRGELQEIETADLDNTLREYYDVGRVHLDSISRLDPEIDLLIIADPKIAYTEKDKFLIDQFIMNGGKTMFLINSFRLNMDSLRNEMPYVPRPNQVNLDDLLFRYGVRINQNLVNDLECSKIPQVVGMLGSGPQFEFFDWYYHPIIAPKSNHPIVKSLDRVNLLFASTIDLVDTKSEVEKTVLLSSSEKSRYQAAPLTVDFAILKYAPEVARFNKAELPLGVLLEGSFSSNYNNRVSPSMQEGLNKLGQPFVGNSPETKIIVIGDGDIARNHLNVREGKANYAPLGFNPFMRYQYANKDFMLNSIEFMMDDQGVIAARTKEVKLRLLNKTKAQTERVFWSSLNIALPLLILLLFGLTYQWIRRRRFAS